MPEATPIDPLALALRHKALAAQVKALVVQERELRAEVIKAVFPELLGGNDTGTFRHSFGKGYELKVEIRPQPGFKPEQLAAALELMTADGDLGKELAGRLVKYTPELRVAEFKKLPPKYSEMLEGVVALGQQSPTVDLTVPQAVAA